MSYILDALKRAEIERKRGLPPDIHAQTLPGLSPDQAVVPAAARRWGWLAALPVLAVLAWLGWRTWAPDESARATTGSGTVAVAASTTAAALTAEPSPAVAPLAAPAWPAPPFIPEPPRAAAAAAPQTKPAPVDVAASAVSHEPIVALKDLPADARTALAALKFGGSVYSPDASKRMLFVDGQLMREGDTLAQGAVLEQIQPKAAVLRFRQYRVRVDL